MVQTWQQWVREQMARHGWDQQVDVVRHSTLKKSVISRWLDPTVTDRPSVDNCRKAAEVFKVPVLSALVAAGHLTPEEAGARPDNETDINKVSVAQLIVELNLRVQAMEAEIKALRKGEEPDHWSHGNDVPGLDFTDQHATRVHLVPSEKLQ